MPDRKTCKLYGSYITFGLFFFFVGLDYAIHLSGMYDYFIVRYNIYIRYNSIYIRYNIYIYIYKYIYIFYNFFYQQHIQKAYIQIKSVGVPGTFFSYAIASYSFGALIG